MDSLPCVAPKSSASALLTAIIDAGGTDAHPYSHLAVAGDRHSFVGNLVDFADFVHLASLLHGQAPGFIDLAASRTTENAARDWLIVTMNGFVTERTHLSRLAVAAGPIPSTSGHPETITLIGQQRHALEMLAQSDRKGCALGAAVALVIEWHAVRAILDGGASRLGIESPPCTIPDRVTTIAMVESLPDPDRLSRAMQFGATQLVGQQRGLWDLLQARNLARRDF